eukprot:784819-Rhodomonas_salina.2
MSVMSVFLALVGAPQIANRLLRGSCQWLARPPSLQHHTFLQPIAVDCTVYASIAPSTSLRSRVPNRLSSPEPDAETSDENHSQIRPGAKGASEGERFRTVGRAKMYGGGNEPTPGTDHDSRFTSLLNINSALLAGQQDGGQAGFVCQNLNMLRHSKGPERPSARYPWTRGGIVEPQKRPTGTPWDGAAKNMR